MPIAITFFNIIVALHVMAVVTAFGAIFAYPVLVPYVTRAAPRSVPALYAGMNLVERRILNPVGGLVLLTGIYLASDADAWSEVWVAVPFVVILLVLGVSGAVLSPAQRRLAELAQGDVARGGTGEISWSADTAALMRRLATGQSLAALLILVAIFFMVAKP
jgi:uncharacterized membrane protein